MSVSERRLKYNLNLAEYYYQNRNSDVTFADKSIEIIKKCYEPFQSNPSQALRETSSSSIIELAEIAFTVSLPDIAEHLINIYFELDNSSPLSKDSFYIRALLIKARVEAQVVGAKELKAEAAATALLNSIKNVQKSLEIIAKPENKQKYATLLYNASIITINILKDYLKINWGRNFWEIIEKLSAMLEEADDVDFNWRILILIKLAQCYIDADKKPEGGKALDKITDILRKKGDCDFMDELYRIRIHLSRDNNGALGNLKKEGESNPKYPQFKYLYTVQAIKSGIITEKDIDKEVNAVVTALCPEFLKSINEKGKFQSDASIKLDAWKADVLAEMAISILPFSNMINLAYNLYYFLVQNGSNSLKGKIYLENMRSGKVMYDLEENLKINVQPNEIVRQKRIEARTEALIILERNMAGCARLQDFNLTNETSMLIFNTAIPFFKKSFRKNFYKAFYTSCDQLEQISSNENLLRAAMHYELAKYYLGEDLLQEANANILKALKNDYSIPLSKLQPQQNQKKAPAKGAAAGNQPQQSEDVDLTNSTTNNVAYVQRCLEQYLVYLKRYVGVKINVYSDPDNPIDWLIFECDNIKNSKNPTVQEETINKCLEYVTNFKFEEFVLPKSEHDFVDEEIEELKEKHNLKIYDDKKHFINICSELGKLCYDCMQYEAVFKIDSVISKFIEELSPTKDIDQLISISELKEVCAKCYSEYLLEEGIEICSNNYVNFNIPDKTYVEAETARFNEWRKGIYDKLNEANKISVSIQQHWLTFNVATTLWNFIHPLLTAPNFLSLFNEDLIPVMGEMFEAMNNAVSYYESVGAELVNTDYFKNIELFVSFASIYGKLLEFKQKQEECIKVCDTMLGRKLESRHRKIFDTLKARAMRQPADAAAGGKKKAPAPKQPQKGKGEPSGYVPSQDASLLSESFANLENAINTTDEKTKIELLKKGIEGLKNYKINFNDESTLELSSELWYKYGVNFFEMKTNECYKYAVYCSENCINTYDNIDIQKKRAQISLTLQKWYCLGFLLYGDCLYNLINSEKQERVIQIDLYYKAIDKLVTSCKIAEKAKQYIVIINAIKAFYMIVINIVDEAENRVKLLKPFNLLHQILISNRPGGAILYGDPEFLLLFYSFFCICINETSNWELGEKIIGEAIKIIPNQYHHILLEHKLFYYSKQGKSFIQNLNSSSEKDVLSKAKLLTKLARSSTNKADQFSSYTKAIELLKNDENIYVCNIIFELASWLYKNQYPFNDIEDNLNQAADILLEIDTMFDDDDDLEDDGQTLHSKRSTSSRKSRLSKRSKSRLSGKSKTSKKKSTVGAKSRASERSKSRNYSRRSSKTRTVFAKMLDYDPYPLYMNLHHMEHLFKIQVFLSMVSNNYLKQQEYLLDAFFILKKMIEMSIKTMNCIEFYEKNKEEIMKMDFINNDVNPLSSLVNNYWITKDMNIPQVHTIPDTLDGWLTYDWPEEFEKRIAEENANNASLATVVATQNISLPNYTFFCQKSFETPYQFYYYFNYMLEKFMNEFYFHSECLFALKFGILYAKYILCNRDIEYSYILKLSRVVHNVVLNLEDNKVSQSIYSSLKHMLENKPILGEEQINKEREEIRRYDLKLNDKNFEHFLPTPDVNSIIEYADDLKSYVSWLELAKEYFFSGYFNYSKEFTTEAKFHSLVMKDKRNFINANLLLANIAFIEGAFDLSCKLYGQLQQINQTPSVMFKIIRNMVTIFNYVGKYEEMNVFLKEACDYFANQYKDISKEDNNIPVISTFYEMYSYSIINRANALIKKYTEKIRLNEYSVVEGQRSNMNIVLAYNKKEMLPLLKLANELIAKSSFDIYSISSLYTFISNSIECLIKHNLFIYVTKEELGVICEIFQQLLSILEDISMYLNRLQTYIPHRIDNSIVYLPVHRIIAYSKILYSIINNIIGEFKNRIKRESAKSEKLSLNDKDISSKFAEGVKYNQEVIDYLNSLTKEIKKMKNFDEQDDVDNMNRYEKSISLLVSCETLIPPVSREYLLYSIEKINSFRLQSVHYKELKKLWDKETLDEVNALLNPVEEQANATQKTESKESAPEKKTKLEIKNFHQQTINLISDFEKKVIQNPNYSGILKVNANVLLKYYFCVIETTGYLNIELAYKGIADYQNMATRHYFNNVIKKYINQNSRDWSTFCVKDISLKNFSFEMQSEAYESINKNEALANYDEYISEIPYYKNANTNFYSSWNEVKNILPNNSAYLIIQMNEDKSIIYFALMTITTGERKVNYYVKRYVVSKETNKKIDNMLQNIKTVKHSLIKTVNLTKEELDRMFKIQNDVVTKVAYDMENDLPEFKEAVSDINDIINPNLELLEQQEKEKEEKLPAKGKKAPPPKKADKNAPPSDLPLPTSNIEQITFLIDNRLAELPFDILSTFEKIPYKSFDFCLNTNVMRLKSVNFAPGAGNLISIPGNVKYYLDYIPEQNIRYNVKDCVTSTLSSTSGGGKNNPISPLEGIISSDHKPSKAEFQKLYIPSNTFIFTSQTAFLYQFPYEILDTSRYAKCKIGIIFDRISNIKNYTDQSSLAPKTFSFSFQPMDTIALMTLCGICSVVTTKWSVDYDEASEMMKTMLENCTSKGYCLSYAISKYSEPKRVLIQKEEEEKKEGEKKPTKPPSRSGPKKEAPKKKEENIVLDDTNSVEVVKDKIFAMAPLVFGLNNVKLV